MEPWNRYDLAIRSALELEELRLHKETGSNLSINFENTKRFVDQLTIHLNFLDRTVNKSEFVSSAYLFQNPLIDATLQIYNVELDDYKKAKRTKVTDFIRDMKTGFELILTNYQKVIEDQNSLKIEDIKILRDYSLKLTANSVGQFEKKLVLI